MNSSHCATTFLGFCFTACCCFQLLVHSANGLCPTFVGTALTKRSVERRSRLSRMSHDSCVKLAAGAKDGDISWIKKAMEDITQSTDSDNSNNASNPSLFRVVSSVASGIAGFAVDSKTGFVAILAGEETTGGRKDSKKQTLHEQQEEERQQQRAISVVIAPSDTSRLSSPESLCMVQLAGGLDLGAAVFPPDELAQVVAHHLSRTKDSSLSTDDIDSNNLESVQELRSRIELLRVDIVSNTESKDAREEVETSSGESSGSYSPERNDKIRSDAPKVHSAATKLPGLQDVALEEVVVSMQEYADKTGNIDREAFSNLLESLRSKRKNEKNAAGKNVKCMLIVSLDNGKQTLEIPAETTFQALALALRYDVEVKVSPECLAADGSFNAVTELSKRFPLFRPIQELQEDAQVMDGFIPSMFFQEKLLDNDQKML